MLLRVLRLSGHLVGHTLPDPLHIFPGLFLGLHLIFRLLSFFRLLQVINWLHDNGLIFLLENVLLLVAIHVFTGRGQVAVILIAGFAFHNLLAALRLFIAAALLRCGLLLRIPTWIIVHVLLRIGLILAGGIVVPIKAR